MSTTKLVSRTARLLSNRSFSIRQDVWTADNVVKSPYRSIEIPDCTIPDLVWNNAGKWGDKTAVVCGITQRSYTYDQLHKLSHNMAANLRKKLKITDGDVICVMMHNSPEYVLSFLGILQAGAELTTVNPIYTAHELQKQLLLSTPKVIIGSPETIKVIKDGLNLAKIDIPVVTISNEVHEGTIKFDELLQDADLSILKAVNRKSEDIAILPYSSGTTGMPKGVELTNRNVVVNSVQQDVEGVKICNDTTNSTQDAVMGVLPFYHIYGLSVVLCHKLTIGTKLVTLPRFQPNSFLTAIKEHRISRMYAAPPLVLFLGAHSDATKETLSSIDTILSGAAPLPKQDVIRVLEKTKPGTDFLQLYGLTETSPLATAPPPGFKKYTSAGFAISNTELKIIDSESRALGPNEAGELCIRGPHIMKGYRNNPEATKASITEDGWFKSGDIATLDVDGSVTIADRLKELIKVKGYQVPPAELESVLKEHPDVLDAGVVGVPDQRTGEVPKAFVVLKEGHKTEANNIMEFVKERVAEYKRVKDVVFLDALPKNPSGKLLRRVLKEKYC